MFLLNSGCWNLLKFPTDVDGTAARWQVSNGNPTSHWSWLRWVI